MTKIIDVAAAILLRNGAHGTEYLLAQRPQGKVYAGYWEFPGGKVEAGESLRDALVREIQEELGVTIETAWPWLSCQFTYPHATVRLKFFRVMSWHGEIAPIEHSGFVWVRLGDAPPVSPVLPANGPILRALELPSVYALTNAAENGIAPELRRLELAVGDGLRLIQIRDKSLSPDDRLYFGRTLMTALQNQAGCCVLVNDDEVLARQIGAHGLHLSSARLMQCTQRPEFGRVAASCHSREELAKATGLGLDFAVLGPVMPTASHSEAAGMGWAMFADLIRDSSIPVYALGGMHAEMQETAAGYGAHGIAQMRGWGA